VFFKKIVVIVIFSLGLLGVINSAFAGYFGYDEWHDVNKNWVDDSNMCWAAAASNILGWGGWGTSIFNTGDKIFQNFKDHWTNDGGLMKYGWDWWLNGTKPPNEQGWSQVNVDGGGNYWPTYDFDYYYHEDWNTSKSMSAIDEYLHSGYGTTLAIYRGLSGHALTCWGYEYDDKGYTDIYVTDSDDSEFQLVKTSVSWNPGKNCWILGDAYKGYHIGGVEAFAVIPEPISSLLFLVGAAPLAYFRYRKKKFARA